MVGKSIPKGVRTCWYLILVDHSFRAGFDTIIYVALSENREKWEQFIEADAMLAKQNPELREFMHKRMQFENEVTENNKPYSSTKEDPYPYDELELYVLSAISCNLFIYFSYSRQSETARQMFVAKRHFFSAFQIYLKTPHAYEEIVSEVAKAYRITAIMVNCVMIFDDAVK